LSEPRIVIDYVIWTLWPSPHALSFYHDNFHISHSLISPWTTLTSLLALVALAWFAIRLRVQCPLISLGIMLFLGAQLLTATVLPLELIYEHRNYFASFCVLLTVIPLLAAPRAEPLAIPRQILLAGLMLCWGVLTALTAHSWGNPLLLAQELAFRAPDSPRAQYELGRTYIIYSHYDPASPFVPLAYVALERSAALPKSSILPEQAMIYMNARMHLPIKQAWWNSLIAKLRMTKPGVQDESSLSTLTECDRDQLCDLPEHQMIEAFLAALSHSNPSPRLLSMYSDFAWNVLHDKALGLRMAEAAVESAPHEPAYRITLIRMLIAQHQPTQAQQELSVLRQLNIGGRLDSDLDRINEALRSINPTASSTIVH
jgi:hypothetical protein